MYLQTAIRFYFLLMGFGYPVAQATHFYGVYSNGTTRVDQHVTMQCGLRCSQNESCESFHVDLSLMDPCVLAREKGASGKEDYVKQEEGRSQPIIELFGTYMKGKGMKSTVS